VENTGESKAVFNRTITNLYAYRQSYDDEDVQQQTCALNTKIPIDSMQESKKNFTARQVERAKKARQVYHALGTPSLRDYKVIVSLSQIRNMQVTLEDVDLAENIFGPDIGALKGKTVRQQPAPVLHDYIEIPPELIEKQQDVLLCIDGLDINDVKFLTTISRNIMYRTTQDVEAQTTQAYRSALDVVFRIYNQGGFGIRIIHCDNEFRSLLSDLAG
jgi:hypothetical protein